MKWDVHPESLKSSYHIRYGGYGGIGYYLVSDTYIALFSRFLACGAYEGHAILDFVAESRSLLRPSTVHSDTHGQSAAIFGLAHLRGIELMPRIRSWQDLHLFRPDAGARYEHIDGLFTAVIDWEMIGAHLPDMLRVVLSIRAGRLLPSAILRRLATYSRKNRLYFAFRELGRAVRTDFLLRYLSSVELRRVIQAATNKSEHFNRYAQWVAFGSSGLATAAERDEQRKMIKYNHLVANLLIFHTAVGMTRALEEIAADGHGAAITPEALAGTSPYLNEHLSRFGSYELDLSKPPTPRRRMSAGRKREAVLRLLRGEDLELVSRELGVTAAELSGWREAFLAAGEVSLKSRPADARDAEIGRLKEKVGELTMANELLGAKVERLEAGRPLARRRSRR